MRVIRLVLPLVLWAACERKQEQQPPKVTKGKTLNIAVVPKGSTHRHWKNVKAGAEKAAQELGNVNVIWQGPHKEDDRQMQIQVVQNLISRGVDGIVLAPLDDQSLVGPVQQAVKRHIPVVVIDSDLKTNIQAGYVATNNHLGGKLCAKRLVEVLGGRGKVIMLKCCEGSAATLEREAGFLEGIAQFGPGIEIVSSDLYAGATFEKAFQVSQNLLNRFAQVDGIFCSYEASTQGMLRALQLAGKAGSVKLVGFDVNQTLLEGVKQGVVQGLAAQDPVQIGYVGVKTIVAVIEGKPYQKRVDTGVTMITRQNLQEPRVQALLSSRQE